MNDCRSLAAGASALLVAGLQLATRGEGGGEEALSVPPGRVAELLAHLAPAAPVSLGTPWPAWSDRTPSGWGGEPTWRRWVELVRAEATAPGSDLLRRAQLAVLARLQGRDGDGWEHLLACAAEPGLLAALLPLFAPGVPQDCLGLEGVLPDGVVLNPALPPSDEPRATLRWLAGTKIVRHDFAVGAARCSLEVSVDRDGLELSLRHLAGEPARVRLVPPLPRGIDAGLLFADWEKLPGHQGPVEFVLSAEASEHSLWLTFHPPKERWPSPRLETLARLAPGRALLLCSPRGDEPHLARFAEALGELLGVPATLRAECASPAPGLEPLVLRFAGGASDERKLVELLGLAEAFALSAPGSKKEERR